MIHTKNIPPGDRPMFSFVRKYILDDKNILDIGCGDCTFISLFGIKKDNYLGIDSDIEKCIYGRRNGHKITCKNVDNLLEQINNELFDVVLAKDILEHCDKPLQVMNFIHKNLKEDGDLFISVPSELSLLIWDDYTHKRGFSKRAIKELLEHSGFKLVKLSKDHSLINLHTCPARYIALFIIEKITKMDFITQNYMVHARKKTHSRL